MADPKTFLDGNSIPEANKSLTRTGIMLVLAPAIEAALGSIEGLDVTGNVAHLRRMVRAIVTLAVRPMLDAGAPPEVVAAQLIEALGHELNERAEKAQAEGQAQADEAGALDAFPIFGKGSDNN